MPPSPPGTPQPDPEEPSDVATRVQRARAGDRAALASLIDDVYPSLSRFCAQLVGHGSAEDLTQETILRATAALHGLRNPERFFAWLFGIAANLARRWWERRARWPLSLDHLALTYPDVDWASGFQEGRPDQAVEEADEAARIRGAVDALPATLARVLLLHYLEGLSYAEIAAALDVPISTVRGRLAASRTRLSHELVRAGVGRPRRRATRPHAQSRPRKEHAMPAPTTPETQSDAPRLVPVMVEMVETLEHAATTQTVARWLEQQLSPPRAAAAEQQPPVDFKPMAERLAPLLREQDLPVRRPYRGVHLKEVDGERRLWLIAGAPEADSMILALRQESTPRPLTHDLTGHLLAAAGLRVTRAAIERHENNTYYATVTVQGRRGRSHDVDSRVTDAICLALRASAPIVVAELLLGRAGPGFVRPDPTSADATERLAAAVTPTAQRALDVMRQEAADLGHRYLGTEHLLLGLLGAGGPAADLLAQHGVTAEKMRHGIAAIVGRSRVLVGETFRPQPNLEPGRATPRLNAVYERALEHAASRDPQRVDTSCLLLGLLGDPGSLAAGLLESAGADPARLRDAVLTAVPVDPTEDR